LNKQTTHSVYPNMVTAILIALNLLAFALELTWGVVPTCETYGLVPAHLTASGLLGGLFLHASWIHLGGNLACLAFAGTIVERAVGHLRFLALYLAAGVLGGLLHVQVDPTALEPMVGASGAICGVLAVMGALRPRLLGFVVGFVLVNVWYALAGGGEGVSFGTHLGGFAVGVLVVAGMRVTGELEAA
jgi:membrane associated rhomboid family serine protease